jgi:Mlc titration factor MtfA (ptsG expression regulator)
MYPSAHNASYQPAADKIVIPNRGESGKSLALHELQHAIQQREGFAKGGGINEFTSDMDALAKLNNMSYSEMDDFQKAMYLDLRKKYKSAKTPEQAYNNLAGEAEARAVQSRMNMTPAQRRATFPEESYDVPMNELIVRYD